MSNASAAEQVKANCDLSSVDQSATAVLLPRVDICARLGQNVRKLREAKGWSQEDYADRAGIHRTYVSDIERGKRNPTVTVVEKLAAPFGVSPSQLID